MNNMPRLSSTYWPLLVTALLAWGCGESSNSGDKSKSLDAIDTSGSDVDTQGTADSATSTADVSAPAPKCSEAVPWQAGTSAFAQKTNDWNLEGVEGTYLSVTDVNGDGYPDLIVRNGGGADDFRASGKRHKWLLLNTGKKSFLDVTESSGIFASRLNPSTSYGRPAHTVVTGDIDNDGDVDVFLGNNRVKPSDPEAETSEIMLNNGDGTFALGPKISEARFNMVPSSPASGSFVDYDRDGNLDLWIVHNEMPGQVKMADSLLKGDGKGVFVNAGAPLGLLTKPWFSTVDINDAKAHSWGWGGVTCDLNNDGYPELLASSYGRAPNHLWRSVKNESGVAFVNESIASGYAFDHRMDWTTNLNAQCYCNDNPTAEDCDTCPAPADMAICDSLKKSFGPNYRWSHDYSRQVAFLGGVTGTTVCTDINNDGLLDLMTYEIVHSDVGSSTDPSEILVNTGQPDVRFARPGPDKTGLKRKHSSWYYDEGDMTGAVFDFDNDGWQDIYIGSAEYAGTRAHLFHQSAPMQFQELDTSDFFEHFRAHGVAVADFDRDGDLDVVVGHSLHRCEGFEGTECAKNNQIRLYENTFGQQNHWLQIQLTGSGDTNRAAIGARVEVEANGVTQAQEIDGGHGRFGLQRDLTLHFGLGSSCAAKVTVHWPSASSEPESFNLEGDKRFLIVQGSEPKAL